MLTLTIPTAPGIARRVVLPEGDTLIGRAQSCDVVLTSQRLQQHGDHVP